VQWGRRGGCSPGRLLVWGPPVRGGGGGRGPPAKVALGSGFGGGWGDPATIDLCITTRANHPRLQLPLDNLPSAPAQTPGTVGHLPPPAKSPVPAPRQPTSL